MPRTTRVALYAAIRADARAGMSLRAIQRKHGAGLGRCIVRRSYGNEDGLRAYVEVVDDSAWDGASWQQVRQAALEANDQVSVLFIVDRAALEPGYPI